MNERTFKRLFEPINIGPMTVRNRIAMPAMGTSFASKDSLVSERLKAYYEARAKGGAGLVIVECTCVDSVRGMHVSNRLVIDNDRALPGLADLAQTIKRHGAKAIVQLFHAGRMAKSKITGCQPVAPSPIPYPSAASPEGEVPRELTVYEISEIIGLFAQAAARARKAGFDGIELHAAHGYLLAEFLSPYTNQRLDQYGGSTANRARILTDILQAIRNSVGADYPVWCRINGQEYGIKNGLTLEDTKSIARMVNPFSNAISISAWGYGRSLLVHMPDTPGAFLPVAGAIKKVVTVPVITAGRLTPETAERAIEDANADIIAMGRQLLADPELPNKLLSGGASEVRPCIACFYCNDSGVLKNSAIACAVNAATGRENEYAIRPAAETKKIVVVGGGPAGMEAARALSLRGHSVILIEKDAELGGQLNLAAIPPHKDRIKPLIAYFATQLKKQSVEVRLNTKADPAYIKGLQPDIVILATGATPVVPRLLGINPDNVVTAADVLAGLRQFGKEVVVIGGGSTGCETAEFLCEKARKVTVIEMLPELATNLGFRDRTRLMLRLTGQPITFLTNARCSGIKSEGVNIVSRDGDRFISADTVVLALGVKPNRNLLPQLEAEGLKTCLAGDCGQGTGIADAINDGLRLGCAL